MNYEASPEWVKLDFDVIKVMESLNSFVSGEVVVVTKHINDFRRLSSIVKFLESRKITFVIIKLEEDGTYIIARAVEEDSTYDSIAGKKVLSDYVDKYGKPRGIVSECPVGAVVKFYLLGREVYFNASHESV
jgi:hypothetical protein